MSCDKRPALYIPGKIGMEEAEYVSASFSPNRGGRNRVFEIKSDCVLDKEEVTGSNPVPPIVNLTEV